MRPDVSVLVVSYRCRDALLACLTSINETAGDLALETVVVDNASHDGTVEAVRKEHPEVRLLASEVNLGFAAAVNLAAANAGGEYLLLLNPDTVVHEGAVERLLAFARAHPEHGLYGGRTLNPDGSLCPGSCWGRPTLWSFFCFATGLSSAFRGSAFLDPESLGAWARDSVREVDIVTGCLLLVPRSVWDELGGLDPRFFVYGEDADLSLRAAAHGYRPAITPHAVVTHEIGVSSDSRADKLQLLYRGKATLVNKHWRGARRRAALALLACGVGLRAIGGSISGRGRPTAWRTLWRERRAWLSGFPDPTAPDPRSSPGPS